MISGGGCINSGPHGQWRVCQVYLKFGADVRCRARQARFVDAYASKKNTEANGEMAFKEPIKSTSWK